MRRRKDYDTNDMARMKDIENFILILVFKLLHSHADEAFNIIEDNRVKVI